MERLASQAACVQADSTQNQDTPFIKKKDHTMVVLGILLLRPAV